MNLQQLSDYVRISRRFMRSVNLERDADLSDSLDGYVVTAGTVEILEQIVYAYSLKNTSRAWTITGVYGTGKSAFANFLAALHAPKENAVRKQALILLREHESKANLAKQFDEAIPAKGFVRAIITGRREPLAHTVIRALARGAAGYWSGRLGRRPSVLEEIGALYAQVEAGKSVRASDIPKLVSSLAEASGTGLLLIIDELGKLLEHAGHTGGEDDLYLLQQLAELPRSPNGIPILLVGILHQAFSEYGSGLSSVERTEWEKVQGRFNNIAFGEASEQMFLLMEKAINADWPIQIGEEIKAAAVSWTKRLQALSYANFPGAERLANLYPIHPVAALVLPHLCARYGQNDRSLFTFLASSEAHGLQRFIEDHSIHEGQAIPLLSLADIYDYFVDAARIGMTNRNLFSKWTEVYYTVREAQGREENEIQALKVIGVLNLVSSTNYLRASRSLVLTALLDNPQDKKQETCWSQVLNRLVEQRIVTYRKQVDEFRIWQGSDFDADKAVDSYLSNDRRSLAEILTHVAALSPVIAQRHSYQIGAIRYFERYYVERENALLKISSQLEGSDGVIAYWLGADVPVSFPDWTQDGKPVVVVRVDPSSILSEVARQVIVLQDIQTKEIALQTDGVARKEIRQRLIYAEELLNTLLQEALLKHPTREYWYCGQWHTAANLNSALSDCCDVVYRSSPVIWNELINRREITAQGARAQREVITALLKKSEKENLAITGNGPEFSIYSSLLKRTGIHCQENDKWSIVPPQQATSVESLWQAIEDFCLSATAVARPVSDLYDILQAPPYGVKRGVIPIFLAAVLAYHSDDVSVYWDGTFLPVLEPSHFELLVKHPGRFSLKYFKLEGIQWEVFKDLESILRTGGAKQLRKSRNATLLTVVGPLVRFVSSLPRVTLKTVDLSQEAKNVRDALLQVREPDRLIFEALPEALGYVPFLPADHAEGKRHEQFRHDLFAALRELQTYYELLLDRCRQQMHGAFGVKSDINHLREDLRIRASYLADKVTDRQLKSFIVAATDEDVRHNQWLESLVMVIADRPVETWDKNDVLIFEMNLANFARRFENLEALQDEMPREKPEGYVARRITITESGGEEVHRLVWVDRKEQDLIERHVDSLVEMLQRVDDHHRQGILITFMKRMLEIAEKDTVADND